MPRKSDEFDDRPIKKTGGSGIDGVIPFNNGMALASYYCGIFGLILCFLPGLSLLGIIPVILGIMGFVRARKDPEARGSVHAWVGILLGTLEVLTGCGIVGFLIFSMLNARR